MLADPRSIEMKDRVNEIKHRQKFRPFAPIVLDKCAHEMFDLKEEIDYSYMQYAVICKHPDKYPAICHVDNTSRVQILTYDQNPFLYNVIDGFYRLTRLSNVIEHFPKYQR